MLVCAMLCYVGVVLNAPAWYWWLWGIAVGIKFLSFCIDLINK